MCLWLVAIIVVSFVPEAWKVRMRLAGPLHLPLHFAVFAVSGFLLFGLWPRGRWVRNFLAVIALASISEVLQGRLADARTEWRDVLADVCGTACAMLLVLLASRRRTMV